MAKHRTRRWASSVALLALLLGALAGSTPARAEEAPPDYSDRPYVTVRLGEVNQENGIRLITNQPDGLTQEIPESVGRQSLPNLISDKRWFYFDVHDTYIMGGQNKVRITVTYKDLGNGELFLEYDSFDPYRPNARVDSVVRKLYPMGARTNSEAWKTAYIELDDARFGNFQPGGADFRVGSTDVLMISTVSVLRIAHQEPAPPLRIFLDGVEITWDPDDVQPLIINNRTLVPVRRFMNALGVLDDDIKWIQETSTVEARLGQTIIQLPLYSEIVYVNGQPEKIDVPATAVAGRTLVPLRWVAEKFDRRVEWDPLQPTVITLVPIEKPEDPPTQPEPLPQQPLPQPMP